MAGGGGFNFSSGAYCGSHGGGLTGKIALTRGNPESKQEGQGTQGSGGQHGYGYGNDGIGSFGLGGNGKTTTNSGTISGGGRRLVWRSEAQIQVGEVLDGYIQNMII